MSRVTTGAAVCADDSSAVSQFVGVLGGQLTAVDLSAERVARNDAVFREANEAIEAAAVEHGLSALVPFICECADPTCTEIVQLSLVEYETVRAQPRWFLNVDGHESAAGPHAEVVKRLDGYVIVEKSGAAGEIVEELDSRDPGSADTPDGRL